MKGSLLWRRCVATPLAALLACACTESDPNAAFHQCLTALSEIGQLSAGTRVLACSETDKSEELGHQLRAVIVGEIRNPGLRPFRGMVGESFHESVKIGFVRRSLGLPPTTSADSVIFFSDDRDEFATVLRLADRTYLVVRKY